MRNPLSLREVVRQDLRNLPGRQITIPVAPRKYPEDLPPVVRVLLGIGTENEEAICRHLSHHLTPADWAVVYELVKRYSAEKPERSINYETPRQPLRYLDIVQGLYV